MFFPASLVVSIMDLGYLRFPQHYTKSIYWKLRLWTALSIKRAARLLTISQATKNDIIRYYKVKAEKIDVEYLGYDEKNFQFPIPDSRIEKAKNKYKIVGDYLLFLSTLKPSKNVEGLLKAFKSVKPKTKNKKLSLVIAGKKGWLFERIFEEVKALDLEEKVLFTDFVDEEDVPALMAGAKAFVLPSFWEGFGIPVVEAMAVGTPVVVSKAGSLPEIVNESGLIVDPGNTQEIARGINKIINDKTLGERLRKEGLFRVKKFNWDECARKTLLVLEKIGNNK
ncbi:glycosyltransferase family 1 protein [Candidatus Shapirobacteria bacterium CG_4_9_14_3_um_filter_39_13]|uniref:Glycosyltransferase family 1 protein n=2 Tax=Candidatus Shapironibacteriota TaxID=1752721 RepID=A0A2M7XKX4_9BACT|nr:MAG: glycosyltransferase family 1 protein [Candidatus Shapirobacteria bacterium CG_4_9_14_3_um_filter_39_13]